MQLLRYINTLRTMRSALVTPDTMTGLAKFRDTAVVTDQIGTTCFPIIGILRTLRNISFVQTLVIVQQNTRYIQSIRTRHTVFAVITRNGIEFHHQRCRIMQEADFLFRQRLQRRIGTQVILKMFHPRHAAQHCQYVRISSRITECP